MNPLNEPEISLFRHGCLALMGGLVREIVNGGAPHAKFSTRLIRFIAGGFVGVFVGLLVFFGCKHLNIGEYMTAVLVGLGGYVGTPLLDVAGRKLKNFIKEK